MNVRPFPSFFSMPIYLFSRKTKGGHPTFEIFFFTFPQVFSLLLLPRPVFFFLFLPVFFLSICSQGQTFSTLFFNVPNHMKRATYTCVLAHFLVSLVMRLAQPKDLGTGGWGKLWNLVVCPWLAECVNIYRCSRCMSGAEDPGTHGYTAG